MGNNVRWGLLSTANINRRLIPAIRASQRGELVAVASRTLESAEEYGAKWQIPRVFGSYTAMLASDAVDAVYISLPNHLHAEWTIKALAAGKHVLCEKPFALTLDDVDAMANAAARHRRVLMEAFMYRHHPQTRLLGDWIAAGRLGTIINVQATFNFQVSNPNNVRLVPEYGGGSLWDVGIYPLSLAQFIFGGPPAAVFGQKSVGSTGVDIAFSGQMVYPCGGTAQISSAFNAPFYTHATIFGTEGRIESARPFVGISEMPGDMVFIDANGHGRTIDVTPKELYLGQIEDMHGAILDGSPTYLTLEETRNHVKTVLALYESAEKNRTVQL